MPDELEQDKARDLCKSADNKSNTCGCRLFRWMIPVVLGVIFLVVGYQLYRSYFGVFEQGVYEPVPIAFQGDSNDLDHTVIVPTLDTPMPEGKNVIWCGSFQLAWNHLKDDVIKEPLLVNNAQEVADRLNQAPFSETDLPDDSYYAAAGLVADGIIDKITQEMSEKFPQVNLPEFITGPKAILSYAYLQAAVDFDTPYFDRQLVFTDSSGQETSLSGFGTYQNDKMNRKLADQIKVLYTNRGKLENLLEMEEFALDLCRTSTPSQIILAQLKRGHSLADILDDLEIKIDHWKDEISQRRLQRNDKLKVPNIHWKEKTNH